MNAKTRIAFYRGRKSQNPAARIGDRLICLVTGKPFSHCELVSSLVTIGGEVYSTMLSSSLRDGGVRGVSRQLVPGRWLAVEFDGDSKPAIAYIRGRIGTPYGWLDLLSFLLPFHKPWRKSPGDLWDWAVQQPGARVVPEDELRKAWSA